MEGGRSLTHSLTCNHLLLDFFRSLLAQNLPSILGGPGLCPPHPRSWALQLQTTRHPGRFSALPSTWAWM